jgi:hypothetical protein
MPPTFRDADVDAVAFVEDEEELSARRWTMRGAGEGSSWAPLWLARIEARTVLRNILADVCN